MFSGDRKRLYIQPSLCTLTTDSFLMLFVAVAHILHLVPPFSKRKKEGFWTNSFAVLSVKWAFNQAIFNLSKCCSYIKEFFVSDTQYFSSSLSHFAVSSYVMALTGLGNRRISAFLACAPIPVFGSPVEVFLALHSPKGQSWLMVLGVSVLLSSVIIKRNVAAFHLVWEVVRLDRT